MKTFYISHPYTGREEENRNDAEEITKYLSAMYPHYVFINPLDMMQAQEAAGLDYDHILDQTLEIACRCDGIIMTGAWGQSRGCIEELREALKNEQQIYDLSGFMRKECPRDLNKCRICGKLFEPKNKFDHLCKSCRTETGENNE